MKKDDFEKLLRYIGSKINNLQDTLDRGTTKAELASLRKGLGKVPGEIPELWGSILLDMPDELIGNQNAEQVVYSVLTLYAFHQQGNKDAMHRHISAEQNRNDNMKYESYHLGTAVAHLVKEKEDEGRIRRRFNVMATSSDIKELTYHLRTIIKMLSGDKIPIDYIELARNLYDYQCEDRRNRVRLRWGEDYFREINRMNRKDNNNEDE